jgi:hypothetical protein
LNQAKSERIIRRPLAEVKLLAKNDSAEDAEALPQYLLDNRDKIAELL